MFMIEAAVSHYLLEEIKNVLCQNGIHGMTILEYREVEDVTWPVRKEVNRGMVSMVRSLPMQGIQVCVGDDRQRRIVVDVIRKCAEGRTIGGFIRVHRLETVVRIRTGETGEEAL